MVLMTIDGTDVTKYINESSYVMNSEPVTGEWVDANHYRHRNEYRRRVKGSFDLTFFTQNDYNGFIDLLNSVKSGSTIVVTVYVGSDVNDLQTITAHYKIEMGKYRGINDGYSFNRMKMTIEER